MHGFRYPAASCPPFPDPEVPLHSIPVSCGHILHNQSRQSPDPSGTGKTASQRFCSPQRTALLFHPALPNRTEAHPSRSPETARTAIAHYHSKRLWLPWLHSLYRWFQTVPSDAFAMPPGWCFHLPQALPDRIRLKLKVFRTTEFQILLFV